jgi:hypothetical protein
LGDAASLRAANSQISNAPSEFWLFPLEADAAHTAFDGEGSVAVWDHTLTDLQMRRQSELSSLEDERDEDVEMVREEIHQVEFTFGGAIDVPGARRVGAGTCTNTGAKGGSNREQAKHKILHD